MTSPFDWRADKRPSIFAADPRFMALKSGKGFSHTGTESVARRTRTTGKNPGTLAHLTKDPAGLSQRHTGAYSRKKAGA